VNGLSIEDLLQICAHRLDCFQAGPYVCEENAEALKHLELALASLDKRTRVRKARGVEGTNAV
jgi:hypothetical protein